jgi:hypothetical protein
LLGAKVDGTGSDGVGVAHILHKLVVGLSAVEHHFVLVKTGSEHILIVKRCRHTCHSFLKTLHLAHLLTVRNAPSFNDTVSTPRVNQVAISIETEAGGL